MPSDSACPMSYTRTQRSRIAYNMVSLHRSVSSYSDTCSKAISLWPVLMMRRSNSPVASLCDSRLRIRPHLDDLHWEDSRHIGQRFAGRCQSCVSNGKVMVHTSTRGPSRLALGSLVRFLHSSSVLTAVVDQATLFQIHLIPEQTSEPHRRPYRGMVMRWADDESRRRTFTGKMITP